MWVRPVYSNAGTPARKAMTSGQWLLDPGEGETLLWVTFRNADSLDLVHL